MLVPVCKGNASGDVRQGERVASACRPPFCSPWPVTWLRVLLSLQRAEELALVRWGAAGWLDAPPYCSQGLGLPGAAAGASRVRVCSQVLSWQTP